MSSGQIFPPPAQLELAHHPQLDKHWKFLQRKDAKAAKQPGHVLMARDPQVTFLPALVDHFLGLIADPGADGDGDGDGEGAVPAALTEQGLAYCERFVEFLIDMLSQLPTRRFLATLLDDRAVLVKCRMSAVHAHPRGRLFSQLVDLYAFYQRFEINDHTGMQLSDDEVASAHYDKLQQLQRLCFAHVPQLRELALSSCGALEKRSALLKHLGELEDDDLRALVARYLRLISPTDPWADDRRFLLEVAVSAFERRRSQRQALSVLPLYPTEEVLWDENLVPSLNYSGEGALALPKLNLQFLTFHDYLLRNFNLFRLEATYEIREDLADVLKRVGPRPSPDGDRVIFSGWARMVRRAPRCAPTRCAPPLLFGGGSEVSLLPFPRKPSRFNGCGTDPRSASASSFLPRRCPWPPSRSSRCGSRTWATPSPLGSRPRSSTTCRCCARRFATSGTG